MIVVRVDNKIRIEQTREATAACARLKQLHEHKNPELGAARAAGRATWRIPPTIKTWVAEDDDLALPRGGMQRVRQVLAEMGLEYRVVDERTEGAPSPNFPSYIGDELRPYQELAVERIVTKEQGIVRSQTGSGKTTIAFAAIARVGLNALVVLPTGGLFKQWILRAKKELGLEGDRLGMIRGGTWRLRPVTIAMQQTLYRGIPDHVRDYFGHVIIDEAQLASARTYVDVINQMPARYRIAVSADERRKDKKEFIAHDLFGRDPICEIDREEILAAGHIVDVELRLVRTGFKAPWYGVGGGKKIDFNRLLDEMTADKDRDAIGLKIIHDEVSAGEQAIILTGRREHVRTLDRFFVERHITSGYFFGKKEKGDDEEFERTRVGILDGSVRVGIGTYKALGFGIDLPAVGVGLATTPILSNPQQTNQVMGRLCRPSKGKAKGRLYVNWDEHIYPTHIDKAIASHKTVLVMDRGEWRDARVWRKANRKSR